MAEGNGNNGINVLLAIILAALVGLGVYYFMTQETPNDDAGADVEVNLPDVPTGDRNTQE